MNLLFAYMSNYFFKNYGNKNFDFKLFPNYIQYSSHCFSHRKTCLNPIWICFSRSRPKPSSLFVIMKKVFHEPVFYSWDDEKLALIVILSNKDRDVSPELSRNPDLEPSNFSIYMPLENFQCTSIVCSCCILWAGIKC